MRLPVATHSIAARARFVCKAAAALLCLCGLASSPNFARILMAQGPVSPAAEQAKLHQSDQWAEIERHLPDPATASPELLEQEGDILRVRRFPYDALDFYKYAMARGGNVSALLNKLGLTEMEMRNMELAQAYFKRAIKLDKKDGAAWNNLGAVEFLNGQMDNSVADYKKAIKLQKRQAVYHANLATAYFQVKKYDHARAEMAAALKIDSTVFNREDGIGGVEAHVLSAGDRARFDFEMAKLYASNGLEDQMIHSLAMACEAGMDVQHEMLRDPILAKFELDPRVLVVVHNAEALRAGTSQKRTVSASSAGETPALPAATNPL